jgi:hypothetical protein
VVINEDIVFATATNQDTFDPVWNESTTIEIGAGDSLTIDIVDNDSLDADDFAWGCDYGIVTGQLVRSRILDHSTAAGSINVSISPP